MGTWTLEYDPSRTGYVYKMFYFNEDVFGICNGGSGGGMWRRTPPTWTRTTGDHRACIWNDLMWVDSGMNIKRSEDGVNWTTDWSPWFSPWDSWSALNGYGDYLRCGSRASDSPLGNHFYRRDTDGNWTETPIGQADNNSFYDIINYGDYVYLSAAVADVYRWTGVAWEDEPTLDGYYECHFTPLGTTMYAAAAARVYRNTGSGWTLDFDSGLDPSSYSFGAISEDASGRLWVVARGSTDSEVYVRSGGSWSHHSTASGIDNLNSVVADENGDLFAGTRSCEFYRYVVDYDAIASGSGRPPQALACDGNGDGIYIGLYDTSANPILVKSDLPLVVTDEGNRIFNPGAGDAINVRASEFTGDYIIVSGKFAANNDTCRRSTDGGTTLTDIDGNWGADRSQPIGLDVNDDDHILLPIDGATDDLMETEDCASWTALDSALPFDVSALAMHDLDPNELFIGNIAAGASLVRYSPNNGLTWSDITGTLDITGGIANIEVV